MAGKMVRKMARKGINKIISKIICCALIVSMLAGCFYFPVEVQAQERKAYGVFIGCTKPDYKRMAVYDTLVIDAEFFTAKQIKKLHKLGCKKIYTYLDVGSLEDYRDYYEDYKDLALAEYENWEGEYWVDVSSKRWQKLCLNRAKAFKKKGVDGFFLDNCDVYYLYPEKKIYKGLLRIVSDLHKLGDTVINGGDVFVLKCIKNKKAKLIDAVNQESVYTRIDFENNKFGRAKKADREYYTSYLKKVKKAKIKPYVLEYSTNKKIRKEAIKYSRKNGWTIYVSSTLNLE